ncbi:MAG TPA: helix-turn-helix domain-containing protein [Dehalococcoidia bacterium]
MQKRYEQACPVARTLDLIGDRWTMLIIRDLFLGVRRFNEFLGNSPGMPPKLLSARLKFLIENGFVAREVYSEFPPRSEYVLTEHGRSLFPIVKALGDWGLENLYDGEEDVKEEVVRLVREAVPELSE